MPDDEVKSLTIEGLTPELQTEFGLRLEESLTYARKRYEALPPGERLKTSLPLMELRARKGIEERYQRIAGVEELRLATEALELYPGEATDYLAWRDTEATLLREEIALEAVIRTIQEIMATTGAPSPWTDALGFFYRVLPFVEGWFPDYRTSDDYKKALAEYEVAITRLQEISTEMAHARVFQSLYEGLGAFVQSGRVTTYEDLLGLTSGDGEPITIFKDMDSDELRLTFNKIAGAILGVPPDTPLERLSYDEVIAQMAKKPVGEPPGGIQPLTVNAIIESITKVPKVGFPIGYPTAEEVLKVYAEAGIPDEVVEELESLESYTRQLEEFWEAISANQAAVLQGLEEAKMPEMGIGAYILQAISQPALAALDLFGEFYRNWTAPWGGMLFRFRSLYQRDPSRPTYWSNADRDFMRIYDEARLTEDWWHAGGLAFAEAELGFCNRFLFEWVADPVSLIGLGVGNALMGGSKVISFGGKTGKFGKFIGPAINIVDKAWLKSWDILIFDRIKHLGKFIEKIPIQSSKIFAGRDMITVSKFLTAATNGRYYSKIPLDDATKFLRKARKWAIVHGDDGSLMAQAGRSMLRVNTIDDEVVRGISSRLGSKLPVNKDTILFVSSIINDDLGGVAAGMLGRKKAGALLLAVLGVADAPANLRKAIHEVSTLLRIGIKNSDDILRTAKDVPDLLVKVFNNSQRAYLDVVNSVAAHNVAMSGRVASTLSKVEWKVMNVWRGTFDRWVVTPMARMYLAFAAYGPGNILEGYIKQITARQIPFNPLRLLRKNKPVTVVNPTARGQRMMVGLHKPLELEAAIPRIEMAGETVGYLGVERMSPALRRWRKVVSGGPIGQVFIDLPGSIGMHQRWDYFRKMFLSLGIEDDVMGPVMQGLAKNVDDAVRALPDETLRALNMTKHEMCEEMFERAMAGPASTRNLLDDIVADRIKLHKGISKDMALADRISGGRVADATSKYPLVPGPYADDLVRASSDGSLWARGGRAIDDKIDDITAGMRDYFVHRPEFLKEKFAQRVDDVMRVQIQTKDDAIGLIGEIKDLRGAYFDDIDDVLRALGELETEMSRRLKFLEFDVWRTKYSTEVYEGLAGYADVVQDGFEQMVKKSRAILDDPKFTALTFDEKNSVTMLIDNWVGEQRYLRDFWLKQRAIEANARAVMPKTQPARGEAWTAYRAQQDKAHVARRARQFLFRERDDLLRYSTSQNLGIAGPAPPLVDASSRKLSKVDIATLFYGHPSQMPQSLLRVDNMCLRSKEWFISRVRARANIMATRVGKTPASLGFTDDAIGEIYDHILREMQMSPKTASMMEPHLMELKGLQDELWSIYRSKSIPTGMADDLQRWTDDLARVLDDVPGYATPAKPGVVRGLSDDFSTAKQGVADKTSLEYYKDWADYTNENASTALARTIYPFWTYELHRLFWLPRASIRQPGLFKAWGTYMDNTEDGYVHIPGTSLEFNLLRGTIFMGGMLRLIRKDYPDYYDRFPGFSEGIDFYSRFGFYPATWFMFLRMFGGKSADGKADFGELLPSWIKTPLNAYIAAFPDSKVAQVLLDVILPEPFRRYTTVLVANAICQREQRTFNGMDILDKMTENLELTEEEQEVWTRALREHGWMGMLMEQAAVLRIRTEEQIAAWDASSKLITEMTGYTYEQQFWIRRHGFRVGDYAQLDPLQQSLLSEMEAMKYHSGIFSSLMPTAWQEEDRRRREFFDEIRSYSEARQADQEILDMRVRLPIGAEGRITMTQWARERSELRGRNARFFTDLSETERYRDIAIEMEDVIRPDGSIREGMISRAKDRNMLPPIEHPAKEILNAYYNIKLEKKIDLATGVLIYDWDGYFLKIDTIIRTLEGVEREDFVEMITKTMTDLERLRWDISRKYFRGYNRRQEAILLTQFNEEEQAIIKRWIFGTPTERDKMLLVEIDGKRIVSAYQTASRITGQNLRKLSPELDAWLQFFEVTDTVLTDEAARLYSEYRREWGIPE